MTPTPPATPWYWRVAYAVSSTRPVRLVLGPKVIGRVDRALLARTGGRRSLTATATTSTVLLVTTGRRSGRPRPVALLAVADGDDLVVVASNFGRDHHPAWSENLLADPRARVACGSGSFDVRARLCDADERSRRWPALVRAMPMWDRYRALTDRELRVFVLERS